MEVLHSRCEQKPNGADAFTLRDAMVKLEHAWKDYKKPDVAGPGGWAQLVHPETQQAVEAPRRGVRDLKAALERFVLIEQGNRVADLARHPTMAVLGLEEFKNSFKNVWLGEKQLPTVWGVNRQRQTVRDTAYWPNKDRIMTHQNERFYNTYVKSDQTLPPTVDAKKILPFMEHIEYLFPETEDRERFLNWLAVTVQRPDLRIPWLPLIISQPGCGKGWIYQVLRKVLGSHNCTMIRNTDIESDFNDYMSGTTLVCIDDLVNNKRVRIIELLSTLITEDNPTINHKYGKRGVERVFCNFIGFTNNRDAASIGLEDRRFWVYEAKAKKKEPKYYTYLFNWLLTDGPAHLELWIRQQTISAFEFAAPPPVTEAKRVMVEAGQSVFEQLLRDSIEDQVGLFQCDIVDNTLIEDFIRVQLDMDRLTQRDLNEIRKIFSNLSFKLPMERYRVRLDNSNALTNKRYRCRSIRNQERWLSATANQIADEYRRAWMISAGREAPAQLKEVKSDAES